MIARSPLPYLRARCDGSAMVRISNAVPAEAPHVSSADCSGAPPSAGAGAAAADLGSRVSPSSECGA